VGGVQESRNPNGVEVDHFFNWSNSSSDVESSSNCAGLKGIMALSNSCPESSTIASGIVSPAKLLQNLYVRFPELVVGSL
jgi:hypothetical protein